MQRPWNLERLGAAAIAVTVMAAHAACLAQDSRPRGEPDGGPIVVRVAVFVVDIDSVDSTDQSFKASIYIEARWKDRSRAANGGATLPPEKVWHPRLQLLNQRQTWSTLPEIVEISADGEAVYRQRVWGTFSQPMHLKQFPFDSQVLEIPLVTGGFRGDEVQLTELSANGGARCGISPAIALPDWSIASFQAASGKVTMIPGNPGIPAMLVHVGVSRNWGYYVLKVIVPLCLIVVMSWAVFWIDPTEIESNVTVSVTAVLTIIAYRFAIAESLPKISYITRMDAFIAVATAVVFLAVIQVVHGVVLVKQDKLARARWIDRRARVVFPVLFLILVVLALVWP